MNLVAVLIALIVGIFLGVIFTSVFYSSKKGPTAEKKAKRVVTISDRQKSNANVYVGNLAHEVIEDDLKRAFQAFGQVISATIIRDRTGGSQKRFAFVEMSNDQEAQSAIRALDGTDFKGRILKVNQAHERSSQGKGPKRRFDKRGPRNKKIKR